VDDVNAAGLAACNVVSACVESDIAKSASANLLCVRAAFSKPIHHGFRAYHYAFCYAGWKGNVVTHVLNHLATVMVEKLKKGENGKTAKNDNDDLRVFD
jgi:uncharacterized membrane protein